MSAQFRWPEAVLSETTIAFAQLQQELADQGITIGVADYGGFRTEADTTRILSFRQQDYATYVAEGGTLRIDQFRPIAPYTHSFHDYGAAFDVKLEQLPAGMTSDQALRLAGAIAPTLGLRWGGTFTNPDPWHFELDLTLADARALYASETGTSPSSTGGEASAMLPADVAGDDSGESAIERELEAQDALTGWLLVGVAIVSALAIALSARR